MRMIISLSILLSLMLAQRSADQGVYVLQDGTACGLEGTATSAAGKDLNRHKNRSAAPQEDKIDPEVSLAAILAPGNDVNRFDPEKAARITAFVVDVKPGGKAETCNCGAAKPIDMDTHIELGLSKDTPPNQRVVVEITPRLRKQMKDRGENWSTQAIHDKIKGKWVEVTGWLLFDTMHVDGAENTNPGGEGNWRATCWEIHPVTNIKILDGPPAAMADLKPATFAALHRAHVEHVARDPNAREAIAKRNKLYLSKFDKSELAEKEAEQKERRP